MEDILMRHHQELLDGWHRCRPGIVHAFLPSLVEGLGHGGRRPQIEGRQRLKLAVNEPSRLPGGEILHDLLIGELARPMVIELSMLSDKNATPLVIGISLACSFIQSKLTINTPPEKFQPKLRCYLWLLPLLMC